MTGVQTCALPIYVYQSSSRYIRAYPSSGLADLEIVTNNNVQPVFAVKGTGTADLIRAYSGATQVLTLDSSGNLGIGTSSPSLLFQVASRGGMSSSGVFYWGQALTGNSRGQLTWDTDKAIIESPLTIAFNTSSTERMRLDSSGNLGLGVTPSAWISTWKAMEYQGGAVLSPTTNNIQLAANAYYGNSGWVYKANGYATNYYTADGAHVWRYAASGTAGDPITFIQAMTLDASGNLGVGTTSPTQKLDVRGSIYVQRDTNPTKDRKSTRLNSSHIPLSRMPSSA